MELRSESFPNGGPIPGEFAFCVPADEGHVAMAPNRNPQLAWAGAPEGTQSFVLICHDPDVPSKPDDVNQEGRSVPADLPRVDFYHWVLVDLPPALTHIDAGSHSDAVTARGKAPGSAPGGAGVQGVNDYTNWFAGDADMEGSYGGYDGPCPPWNDERLHHYHFTLYALDTASLGLSGDFGGARALEAMAGHVLAKASWTGTYTLNPALRTRPEEG
ncbi:toluene-induced BbsI protein-like protein [Plesiocystis pacifica SIR-1]|uniref:Toluene-induced BbsI protein-like protein n=1 Tax=Plesiocystis pacifica SIR-1 TaxID=391625 RepID=A6FXM3_9BACT|nr:YbhB/YbcL family Raf kinase inhibitor-like protein [Plesiocystis pacifica]EDM81611.1 toluene-induced BbsI protein-like protein [Plesiocystis pacifica SIR-1]